LRTRIRLRRAWDDLTAGLVLRFSAVLALYSVCRVAFFFANRSLFADMSSSQFARALAGGLLFDLSAAGYTNLLYVQASLIPVRSRVREGYQRALGWLFVLINGIALAANCMDIGYYRFSLRRTTSSFFREFEHEANLAKLTAQVILFGWPIALLWMLMLGVLLLIVRSSRRIDLFGRLRSPIYYPVMTLIWLCITFLLTMGMRGGSFSLYNRPITLSNAGAYVDKPHHSAVVLNTPFSILRTLRQPALERERYFATPSELEAVYDPVHKASPPPAGEPWNLVLIILESFGAEHVGGLNKRFDNGTYQGFTPFFDELMQRGLTFTNAFANGTKTIDAMPSVTASIPMLVESFNLSHYSGNRVSSIASLLKERGYETMFFHGAPNGSMGMEAFIHLTGYDRYFGMREYGNDADFDGSWGIWDEEFFQFFARKLGESKRPFFATLFSVSSHHPYRVPKKYEGKFRKGPVEVEEPLGYTDYALRRLFETMATLPYYQRTLFVLTSDHASMQYRPEYKALVGRFRIPILFYRPDGSLQGTDDRPAQQIDILPTVMRMLGSNRDYVAFGNDLLDSAGPRFVVLYTDGGLYQLIQGDHVLHWDGKRTVGLYQYRTDPLLEQDLSARAPELRSRMERLMKAVIQQYNTRMIDDRLTVGPSAHATVVPR
jgi:arylsulfatase A-like enzyme